MTINELPDIIRRRRRVIPRLDTVDILLRTLGLRLAVEVVG